MLGPLPTLRHAALVMALGLVVITTSNLTAQVPPVEPRMQFRRHLVNPHSQFSASTVFDVNRDGHLDIFCGGFWYEGPQWTPHVTRQVAEIRGRFDDYSNLPWDVNADGWLDVISVNYRSQLIYWVENPAGKTTPWATHTIDQPGTSETGQLGDIDGDGQLDLLPNGTNYAAWYSCDPSGGSRWSKHLLPAEIAGHGIGFGDIDGDRRGDIITSRGWWQAPADPRSERWRLQADFRLHRDSSIPILVHDVDADGDADLIWGRGHNVGIYWMEQHGATADQKWELHPIDTELSSIHTLITADVNGDGSAELIAGRRYLGHDGQDPGEWMPLEVNVYSLAAMTKSWHRQRLSWGGQVGIDLGTVAADLDADGDLDFVAPTRIGLSWFENCPGEPGELPDAETPVDPVRYAADESLLTIRTKGTSVEPVSTRTDWGLRRWQILHSMSEVMGKLPAPEVRVPLAVRIESREAAMGYTRIKLSYQSEPGDRVPAWLLVPDGLKGPAPAMLCLHPTHPLGKGIVCGMGGQESRHYAHELAQAGFVCLAPDYPSFGDYPYDFARNSHYQSGTMKAIWNNVRAVDLLESLPEVDPDRIGCIGHSLGGHNALFTAAFDLRLRAVVTSCGFTAFADYYGGRLAGWTSDRYMPRIRDVYAADPARMPFDFHEVLAAIAPRPVFVNAPLQDDNFAVEGVRRVIERVQPIYGLFDADECLRVVYPPAAHDFPDDVRSAAYAWLKVQLMPSSN